MGNRRSGKRHPQQVVRIARFERSLDAFNVEMAQKVAQSLKRYHEAYVEPLEQRVAYLESPWYKKAAVHLEGWWLAARIRFGPPIPAAEAENPQRENGDGNGSGAQDGDHPAGRPAGRAAG